jgi:hypothetical protein
MSALKVVAEADHRNESRLDAELKAIVQIKDGPDDVTKEVAAISTVSRNGAGFSLSRKCDVGRLVTIVLPMPPELRAYDSDKELYPVLGIVQYCNEGMIGSNKVYHVGVGFIGKKMPESYKTDPTQNYRITGMTKDGLWEITEAGTKFQNRKKPRYWVSLPVTVSLIQKEEKSITREETYTKNVGAGGVSVTSALNASVGDKVKFACRAIDFYAIGVVRNIKSNKGESPTLHLEFLENEFPIEKVIRGLQAAA